MHSPGICLCLHPYTVLEIHQQTPYYCCVEDHLETLEQVYEDRFEKGLMRIISIIKDQEVIDKILGHLGLGQKNRRPPPKPKSHELQTDYPDSQLSFYDETLDQDFEVSADQPTV